MSAWLVRLGLEAARDLEFRNEAFALRFGVADPLGAEDVLPDVVRAAIAANASHIYCAIQPAREDADIVFLIGRRRVIHKTVSRRVAARLAFRIDALENGKTIADAEMIGASETRLKMFPTYMQTLSGAVLGIRFCYRYQPPASGPSLIGNDATAFENRVIVHYGPTYSGKTLGALWTLVCARPFSNHTISIEDPIEYDLTEIGVSQFQRDSSSLPGIIRQNPGVVYVGEIRDSATARLVYDAQEVGATVVTTMHAADAASAEARLRMFLNSKELPFPITLIRHAREDAPCPSCSIRKRGKIAIGAGCDRCKNTGYHSKFTSTFEGKMATE